MREKLESLSSKALKDIAKTKGLKNISSLRKAEVIEELLKLYNREQSINEEIITENITIEKVESEKIGKKLEECKIEKQEEVVTKDDSDKNVGNSQTGLDSGELAQGILEVMSEGYGFIRCDNYLPGEGDVYVSPAQIRRFTLRTGDILCGNKKIKTPTEKFSALLYLKSINGVSLDKMANRIAFEEMVPIFPNQRLKLETSKEDRAMRILDLVSPIGKGQRGMIVSQPKAGKTTLLKSIASSVLTNNPEMHMIILLIDERPEEVTDIKESITGDNVEVIYSTFDELPEHHKRVSEMVLERCKRLVEMRKDVIVLLDSITRLTRAYILLFRQVEEHYQEVLTLQHFICLKNFLVLLVT